MILLLLLLLLSFVTFSDSPAEAITCDVVGAVGNGDNDEFDDDGVVSW